MKYKKCPRCNLNYVVEAQNFCEICQLEMSGKSTNFDPIEWDFCPFCEKNRLRFLRFCHLSDKGRRWKYRIFGSFQKKQRRAL